MYKLDCFIKLKNNYLIETMSKPWMHFGAALFGVFAGSMFINGVLYALSPQKKQIQSAPQRVARPKSQEEQFSDSLHKAIKEKVVQEKGYDPYSTEGKNNINNPNFNSPYSSDHMSALDDPYGIRKK